MWDWTRSVSSQPPRRAGTSATTRLLSFTTVTTLGACRTSTWSRTTPISSRSNGFRTLPPRSSSTLCAHGQGARTLGLRQRRGEGVHARARAAPHAAVRARAPCGARDRREGRLLLGGESAPASALRAPSRGAGTSSGGSSRTWAWKPKTTPSRQGSAIGSSHSRITPPGTYRARAWDSATGASRSCAASRWVRRDTSQTQANARWRSSPASL